MKKIILTGGGSAGHVTPNLALIPELERRGFQVEYICSKDGMEREILEKEGLSYHAITTDKLRRYASLKTLAAPVRIQHGYHEALRLLRKEKPDVIFAKGGYVSVPVVKAAKRLGIPTLLHESDLTPGLANRMCFKDVAFALCNFPETLSYLPEGKSFVSGCPIRDSLKDGSPEAGLAFTGLPGEKPVLLIIGGSLGSVYLNTKVRENLDALLERFEVVHLCGKGHLDESLRGRAGYVQYEFISEQMKDLFAMASVVLSRAGANAICELLYLHKPMLLVPLSKAASRGDQILNARSFEKQGFALVMEEEEITDEKLLGAIGRLYAEREQFAARMAQSSQSDAVRFICGKIEEAMKQ